MMTTDQLTELLNREYATNEKFKALADQIHDSRMLPPPACEQCRLMAATRLGIVQASEVPEDFI